MILDQKNKIGDLVLESPNERSRFDPAGDLNIEIWNHFNPMSFPHGIESSLLRLLAPTKVDELLARGNVDLKRSGVEEYNNNLRLLRGSRDVNDDHGYIIRLFNFNVLWPDIWNAEQIEYDGMTSRLLGNSILTTQQIKDDPAFFLLFSFSLKSVLGNKFTIPALTAEAKDDILDLIDTDHTFIYEAKLLYPDLTDYSRFHDTLKNEVPTTPEGLPVAEIAYSLLVVESSGVRWTNHGPELLISEASESSEQTQKLPTQRNF